MAINPELVIKYWLAQSMEDLKSARVLLEAHRYTWCAFICQQALEKGLKAGYVKIKKSVPPHIHKLERLCQLLELIPPEEILSSLIEIDKYYIATRYPSYREAINIRGYKKAEEIFGKTEEIYKWLVKELKL